MNAHDFQFRTIEGDPLPLADFAGKVMLVVNTASYCGLTPQYAGLQALHLLYRDRGLVVLGVPCNDFGAQEPNAEPEISRFCTTRFGVEFPLTAKEPVIGPYAHPFYRWVAAELGEGAAPKWNFHKYLVGRDGELAGTYGSRTAPDAPELVAGIEEALGG
jgi:glutathione peroxidase